MKTPKPGRVLLAATLLLTGCSFTPKHTITAEAAIRRMDAYLKETIKSVPVHLDFIYKEVDPRNGSGCAKWYSDSGFTGQVTPSITYRAVSDDSEATGFLNATAAHWTGKSAAVANRPPDGIEITPYEHYRLFVSYYRESHLVELLGVFKGCIWRYGTPQPDDDP